MKAVLGSLELRSPLIAASGTVGSVVDAASAIDFSLYGAAVAKSVSAIPWTGRPAPRMAPAGAGMLNGIGIQNPGIEEWERTVGPRIVGTDVPVWGSAVGSTVEDFVAVAIGLERAGVAAVEVNLSCPNLDEAVWALDAEASRSVIAEVVGAVSVPVGAKLSPAAPQITPIAEAVLEAGAAWLVLTNTMPGAAIDLERRAPVLSGVVGGYSGPGMKPLAVRCVLEVTRDLGQVPIVGTGGVRSAVDAIEFIMAGASAVGIGTAHFESPRCAGRILRGMERWMRRHGVTDIGEILGSAVAA